MSATLVLVDRALHAEDRLDRLRIWRAAGGEREAFDEAFPVRRYVDTAARHGWLYQLAGAWIVEHCVDGEWTACPLTVPTGAIVGLHDGRAATRDLNMAAMRHLSRRPHRGPIPEQLRGTHHA